MEDKIKVIVELERLPNGTVNNSLQIVGEGFFHYEIVGLLQVTIARIVAESIEQGKKLPEGDTPIRMKYGEENIKED